MAHKPITNDTLMVDMIEIPGNKNSQDQILIQDNSAIGVNLVTASSVVGMSLVPASSVVGVLFVPGS
jgi:hypothetical protein